MNEIQRWKIIEKDVEERFCKICNCNGTVCKGDNIRKKILEKSRELKETKGKIEKNFNECYCKSL